jgi:sulfur transfer complex TusBCD TusB component (DsrH family)
MNLKLLFPIAYTIKMGDFDDIQARGYVNCTIKINSSYFEVVFYSKEGILAETNSSAIVAEVGMIIIKELTLECMQNAVISLCEHSDFFKKLREMPKIKFKDYKEADISM